MAFYVDFVVKRNGTRLSGVEISYRYNGSSRNLSTDQTDRNGEVRTRWDSVWEGREVEVFFDGGHRRTVTLKPRDTHSVSLPGGCFSGDTPILTPLGERAIASIAESELVMALDTRTGGLVACPVIQRADHGPTRLCTIHLQDGRALQVTDNHRLLTGRGYRFVANLAPGDRLISLAASPEGRLVRSVQMSSHTAPVHNLIVAKHFNFIAAGCVAHSFSKAPVLQRAYWEAKVHLPGLASEWLRHQFKSGAKEGLPLVLDKRPQLHQVGVPANDEEMVLGAAACVHVVARCL